MTQQPEEFKYSHYHEKEKCDRFACEHFRACEGCEKVPHSTIGNPRPHPPAPEPTMKEIVILLKELCVKSNCWGDKNTENCPFNTRGQIHCELTKIKNLLESELEIIGDEKRAEAAYHQGVEAGKTEAARAATLKAIEEWKRCLKENVSDISPEGYSAHIACIQILRQSATGDEQRE